MLFHSQNSQNQTLNLLVLFYNSSLHKIVVCVWRWQFELLSMNMNSLVWTPIDHSFPLPVVQFVMLFKVVLMYGRSPYIIRTIYPEVFIMLYKVVFESVDEILNCDQLKEKLLSSYLSCGIVCYATVGSSVDEALSGLVCYIFT